MSQLTRYGFSREAGERHKPVPLVRRPVAYSGPWPCSWHRTMAEVMADEAGSNEIQAKAGVEAQGEKASEPCAEPVSRAAIGRSIAATSEPMDVTAGETAPDLEAVQIRKPVEPDWKRVAAAARNRPAPAPSRERKPTRYATSADPCHRCGVPGFRGCEHQLPYDNWLPADERDDIDKVDARTGPKYRSAGRHWRL